MPSLGCSVALSASSSSIPLPAVCNSARTKVRCQQHRPLSSNAATSHEMSCMHVLSIQAGDALLVVGCTKPLPASIRAALLTEMRAARIDGFKYRASEGRLVCEAGYYITCGARVMWNSRVSMATAVGTLIFASCCPTQFLHGHPHLNPQLIFEPIRVVRPSPSCTQKTSLQGLSSNTGSTPRRSSLTHAAAQTLRVLRGSAGSPEFWSCQVIHLMPAPKGCMRLTLPPALSPPSISRSSLSEPLLPFAAAALGACLAW